MIASLNLYQTTYDNMLKAACHLLQKCYQENLRTLVVTKDSAMSTALDNLLWSFAQKSFIPHALASDMLFDGHPIIITNEKVKAQGFDALVLLERFDFADKNFKRVMCFFTEEGKPIALKLKTSVQAKQSNYYMQNAAGHWSAVV